MSAKAANAQPVPSVPKGGRGELERLLGVLSLPDPWTDFFVFQSYGESRWHSTAHNDSVGERKASGIAYDRNEKALAKCPFPRDAYVQGSGGWGGLLYANAAMQFDDPANRCVDPYAIVHDPQRSLAAMVGFANGLQGWKGWRADPTFVNTRVGWGRPGKMGNDNEHRASRKAVYAKTLTKIGLPAGLLEMQMPRLHMNADEALLLLRTAAAGSVS